MISSPSQRSWCRSQAARRTARSRKRAHRIALGIKLPSRCRRVRRMQQVSVLCGEQEDQPIDETKKLAKKFRQRQRAGAQSLAQSGILGMREKSSAETEQCRLDAIAQFVASGDALLLARFTPAFEGAIGRRRACQTEAARMNQKPERREIREQLGLEHATQIGLDVSRSREARIVTHEAQPRAIGAQAPERAVARIQPILYGRCGRAPPPVRGQLRARPVEIIRRRHHHHRHTTAKAFERNRELAVTDVCGCRRDECRRTQTRRAEASRQNSPSRPWMVSCLPSVLEQRPGRCENIAQSRRAT